jgi:hypothetical protein
MKAQANQAQVSEGQAAIIRMLARQAANDHLKGKDNARRSLRTVQQ